MRLALVPLVLIACTRTAPVAETVDWSTPVDPAHAFDSPETTLPADQAAGPPFTFLVPDVLLGEPLPVGVTGAPPGARVIFFASLAGPGNGPCHPSGSPCLGLRQAIRLASTTANGNGRAQVVRQVPNSLPNTRVWFQAAVISGGAILSNVEERPVLEEADTFNPGDTDTDGDSDTDVPSNATLTTTDFIHLGIHPWDQLLRLEGLVVTARRFLTSPPASNEFTVQDPSRFNRAAVTIFVSNQVPPDVGDVVDVQGVFESFPAQTAADVSLARLRLIPGNPEHFWNVTGTSVLPAPVSAGLAGFQSSGAAEPFESMLVVLDEATPLEAVTNPNGLGDVTVSTAGTSDEVVVETNFFDASGSLTPIGTQVDTIRGILRYELNGYKLAPTTASDVTP